MSLSNLIAQSHRRLNRLKLGESARLGLNGELRLVSLPAALVLAGVVPPPGEQSWSSFVKCVETTVRERWPGSGSTQALLKELGSRAEAPLPGFLIGLAVKPDAILLDQVKVCADPAFAAAFAARVQNDIYLAGRQPSQRRDHLLSVALLVDDERVPAVGLSPSTRLIPVDGGPVEACFDLMEQHYARLRAGRR